ncbi:LIM domain-containing protein PLIM2c [Populus alba x Populus x berolinensis]|uniref:LIM domain-containing protein PLIM2c n=1 Tax=Populus alba x Populus x berolinensis TaxID=444605 RepID=A0AAD6RI65_9ROSI|nr:LIM domain-containing protein PLIM2c [Populus alba x Populus x berolinensis]
MEKDGQRPKQTFLHVSVAPSQTNVPFCKKTAYPLEKVTVEGEFYHKSMLQVALMGVCYITPSSYAKLFDGILYCKAHFAQLFKQKGSYSYLTKTATMKKNAVNLPAENPKQKKTMKQYQKQTQMPTLI